MGGSRTAQQQGTAITALLAAVLASCGNTPSKGEITQALNATLKRQSECFALADMSTPVVWPLRLDDEGGARPLPTVLLDMAKAGYVQIGRSHPQPFGAFFGAAVVTPTEQAKAWWDAKLGWCAGTRAVADLQDWTLPGEGAGQPVEVRFTWHVVDVPAWARRPEFDDMPGMQTPVPGVAVLRRTSKGWVAT